jgi:RHS repeat-associated protein
VLSTLVMAIASGVPTLVGLAATAAGTAAPPPGGLVSSAPGFGRTEGKFSVSDDGVAQYNLPLWLPKGRGDLTPALSLSYQSRGGNGLLGVGWSLSGISSRIAPCPRTPAQDGARDGVVYGADDRLCLDGNRLIQVQPTADNETQYRTEHESFARIIGYGAAGTVPTHFKVWTKDGKIQTFGQLSGSQGEVRPYRLQATDDLDNPGLERTGRVTAAWLLNRVDDRNGNSVTIHFETFEGDAADLWYVHARPDRITYSPDRWVQFDYEDRPDQIDSFDGGVHTRITQRLRQITMGHEVSGGQEATLRQYRLEYLDEDADSITGRSLLSRISECDADGTCMQPLNFGWSMGDFGFDPVDTTVTDAGTSDDSGRRLITGDLNKDGRDDIIYPNSLNELVVRDNIGIGFSEARFSGIHRPVPDIEYRSDLRPVDFDRDGDLDMVAEAALPDVVNKTELALFERTGQYAPFDPDVDEGHESLSLLTPRDPAYFLDLDGNGLADYATARQDGPSSYPWHYSLNTGETGEDRFAGIVPTASQRGFTSRIRVLDSTGDGRDELLLVDESGAPNYRYRTFGMSADGLVETRYPNLARPSADIAATSRDLTLADVNGDGLQDAVYVTTGLRVQLNSGNGFGPVIPGPGATEYLNPQDYGEASPYDNGVRVGDFDNDGKDDIFVVHVGTPTGPGDHTRGAHLYTWRDNGFVRVPLNVGLADGNSAYRFAPVQPLDFDANGVLDLIHVFDGHLRVLQRKGTAPDQLIGIKSGDVPRFQIEYKTMAVGEVDNPVGRGICSFPLVCPTRGGTVVWRHHVVNGQVADGWNDYSHTYGGARVDTAGRGWLGFAWHKVVEERTGATTLTEFDNETYDSAIKAYPLALLPAKVTYDVVTHSSIPDQPGRAFKRTTSTEYEVRRHNTDRTFTVVPIEAADTEQENGTTLRARSTTLDFDAFGNQTRAEGGAEGGRSFDDVKEYENDVDDWLIGKLRTHTSTGCSAGACQTRKTTYDYYDNGNPKTTVVEPDDAELKLTTTTEYTNFGAVKSVSRTNNAGEERKQTIEYDDEGLFPAATVNELEQRMTTGMDTGLGVMLDTTDLNGVLTTMKYDKFGRLRETNRSDGSFERIMHTFVADAGFDRVDTDTSGGGFTRVTRDKFGREVTSSSKSFGGAPITAHTEYDVMGRVSRESRPAFEGQPLQFTSTTYDNRDRVTSVTAPDGVTVRHEYDGRETHTYDGRGIHSYTVTNVDGDVDARYEDDPGSANWLRTKFTYGPFGEVTGIEAPDRTKQAMTYDVLGRRKTLDEPSSGLTTTTFNAFGELATETDAEQRTTTYEYDLRGRIKKVTSPDGETVNVWDTQPHGVGKLASGTSPDGVLTEYTYDDIGRTSTATWTIDGERLEVGYGYDAIGRQNRQTYPAVPGIAGRFEVAYVYNDSGFLAQVKDAATGTTACTANDRQAGRCYWTAENRNGDGQLLRESFGNGVVTENTYEPESGLLQNITTTGPGQIGQLSLINYDHDDNRNVELRDDLTNLRRINYEYDELNRLKRWYTAVPSPTAEGTFGYDSVGNMKSETLRRAGRPDVNTTYDHGDGDAPPHALTSRNNVSFRYDGVGRQISGDGRTITYNSDDLPKVMTWGQGKRTEFKYDAEGARVVKSDNDSTLVSIPEVFERRRSANGEVHNLHHIVVEGRIVAQITRVQARPDGPQTSTLVRYLHEDLQGSTSLVTNSAGREINEDTWLRDMFYDPWGRRVDADHEPLGPQHRGSPRQGYTGHEHDDEFGLIYMKGRMYDAAQRRFITADTIVPDPLASQSQNRYAYVQNNPATLTDPTGHAPWITSLLPGGCGFLNPFACGQDQGADGAGESGGAGDSDGAGGSDGAAVGGDGARPAAAMDDDGSKNTGQQADTTAGIRLPGAMAETLIGLTVPPSLAGFYDKRSYVADHWEFSSNRAPTMQYMADRLAARWGYASTHLDFWTRVSLAPAGGINSGVGSVARGTLQGMRLAGAAAQASGLARLAAMAGGKTAVNRFMRVATADVTLTLMRMRDTAVQTARSQAFLRGGVNPRQFGNLADEAFKRQVVQAVRGGHLSKTIRVTANGKFGPDVWDSATGVAWDLTTATVREVAGHDKRYIGAVMKAGGRAVTITDVIPLVYTRK